MNDSSKTVRNAALLGVGALLSRILGLLRDVLIAAVLGGGWVSDIFLAAFRIPNFARKLLQEGAIALSFIPIFNAEKTQQGEKAAFTFGRLALLQCVLAASITTTLGIYISHWLALALLPGFSDHPGLLIKTAKLLDISLLCLPFMAAAAVISGILMAGGRFTAPAFSPALLNVFLLIAGVLSLLCGYDAYTAALVFCASLIAGSAMQVLFQLPALRKQGCHLLGPVFSNATSTASAGRKFLQLAPLSVLGSASYQLSVLLATLLASFLGEGNVTALYFAERLLEFPLLLVGAALGTASLGNFANLLLQGRKKELTLELRQVLAFLLFLSLPATLGLAALAPSLVSIFFKHGAFNESSLYLTSTALLCYAPALPAAAVSRPLLSALNAQQRAGATSLIALVSLVFMLVLAIILKQYLHIAGIALSLSAAAWLNTLLLALILRRSDVCAANIKFFPWKPALQFMFYSLVMYVALVLFKNLASDYAAFGPWSHVVLGVPLGLFIYLGLCTLSRVPEVAILRSQLMKRKKNKSEG